MYNLSLAQDPGISREQLREQIKAAGSAGDRGCAAGGSGCRRRRRQAGGVSSQPGGPGVPGGAPEVCLLWLYARFRPRTTCHRE